MELLIIGGLSLLLVQAITGAIGTLVYAIQTPKVGERFTKFNILGPGGMMKDYPREVILGRETQVMVEITNQKQESGYTC